MKDIYKLMSNETITFMRDIENTVEINATDRFKYFDVWDFHTEKIREFLYNLDDETFYVIIPFVTVSGKLKDPILILSKQIIVTRNSNYQTIYNYIFNQFEISKNHFKFDDLEQYNVYFKFRKVTFSKKFP
jgi:hypothetical protein